MNGEERKKILVIKLGALGDFIQAFGAMAAIRRHHAQDHITLLTTKPFTEMAEACGYFNMVWIHEKPRWFDIPRWIALKAKLDDGNFFRVYDLQNNDRTALYFRLFSKKPEWVGAARGASHRNASKQRTAGHAFDGHAQTLALAGIRDIQVDPLEWMKADLSVFPLREPYVVLVPGSSPAHPQKRWPVEGYIRLAEILSQWGYQPVLIGSKAEENLLGEIAANCPQALNLAGLTALTDIAALGRGAAACIGNDTGPMHLLAATGCPTLVLFSKESNLAKHGPKGADVKILQAGNLQELSPEKVLKNFKPRTEPQHYSSSLH